MNELIFDVPEAMVKAGEHSKRNDRAAEVILRGNAITRTNEM